MPSQPSLLAVVTAADNAPGPFAHAEATSHPKTWSEDHEDLYPFHLTRQDHDRGNVIPIGWFRPQVADLLLNHWPAEELGERHSLVVELDCVHFADWVLQDGMDGMDREMARLSKYMKDSGYFAECLDGWRGELYAVYGDLKSSYFSDGKATTASKAGRNHVFSLERAACAVFGLATYGVHMTAYEGEGENMKIWVPRRSATKATWPGKLDNSVAGGIPSGMTPFECLVKECHEEASLPEQLVRQRAKPAGVTTYFYVTEKGWLQPEIEYIYDLRLPHSASSDYSKLAPLDDEVESFKLMSVQEVISILHKDPTAFKPNCGLIIVDFLVRHGFVSAESEPNFIEITTRCHRNLAEYVAMPLLK
ncbi:hypothetical protein NliqN6_1791 [Naganishia liquefaciens]|uniref:Nudix hydrolase domain-containing protein n=1 Tax=Naganishia liquefaciens TaxID=104408 RepID=A0A8H3YDJ5_9TREE|nr:hypothetical protein NliqN6_1791 [Naganishia liquefaciens]